MQGYKMPTFGFHWSLSSIFPENSILMLEWLWNNLSVLLFFYYAVCHGSELFTHLAKTDIHDDSFTKSGRK